MYQESCGYKDEKRIIVLALEEFAPGKTDRQLTNNSMTKHESLSGTSTYCGGKGTVDFTQSGGGRESLGIELREECLK